MKLASQLNRMGTENAFAVSAMASDWQARGNRIFSFHLGDINIPPPRNMVDAVARAIDAGKNGYCPGAGIPLLREQLARVLGGERGIAYGAENVAVQPGGKPVIGKFLAAVMNPGEEVLYPVPGFPIYESQISYQGGVATPYYYHPNDNGGFSLDLNAIAAAITPNTRAIIFNNYHNPTGATATQEEIDAVAKLAREHDLWVLADDAYFNIRFDGEPARNIIACDGMMERTVILFTCSKQFAMTGWRLGAAVGPVEIINAIAKMNTNIESCTTHFVQQAVGESLRDGVDGDQRILAELKVRRDALVEKLNAIDGVSVTAPRSAFYVYCDAGEIMRRKNTDTAEALMRDTLHATGVSFCTGAHFGENAATTRHLRFAYSGISADDINDGISALKDYFES